MRPRRSVYFCILRNILRNPFFPFDIHLLWGRISIPFSKKTFVRLSVMHNSQSCSKISLCVESLDISNRRMLLFDKHPPRIFALCPRMRKRLLIGSTLNLSKSMPTSVWLLNTNLSFSLNKHWPHYLTRLSTDTAEKIISSGS